MSTPYLPVDARSSMAVVIGGRPERPWPEKLWSTNQQYAQRRVWGHCAVPSNAIGGQAAHRFLKPLLHQRGFVMHGKHGKVRY